jgi:LPS-assembly lipoprotein
MSRTGSSTSSTDARHRRRARRTRATALAAGLLLLGGCGFEPVYGERSLPGGQPLAYFDIDLIGDRTGQMLRNELLERMHPRGENRAATGFVLRIRLQESRQGLAVRKDDTATRANLNLVAQFAVYRPGDSQPIFNGTATSVVSHNILAADYANIAARDDARRRGVNQLADLIKERLSVWLLQTGGRPAES